MQYRTKHLAEKEMGKMTEDAHIFHKKIIAKN